MNCLGRNSLIDMFASSSEIVSVDNAACSFIGSGLSWRTFVKPMIHYDEFAMKIAVNVLQFNERML